MGAFLVFLLAFPASDSKDDTRGPPAPGTSEHADRDGVAHDSDGVVQESRELQSYPGFSP